MNNLRIGIKATCVLWILYAFSVAIAQADDSKQQARQILEDTDIKGGLIVHLGSGDGKLTAELRANDRYIVHGLDLDAKEVTRARDYIQSLGIYGKVSVNEFDGRRLPYTDNLVNLIVVEDRSSISTKELDRALCPNGVAYIRKNGGWTKRIKPRPEEIDEWTHHLHGPDNNAVASDSIVGSPFHLQWLAGPKHLRAHEYLNSISALVSAGGRIFYIIDEGSTAAVTAPPQWRLVARDAFNGTLLWKRDIGPWEGHFRLFRSGPPDVGRRLVAVANKVYSSLGYGKPVAAFDAATGLTARIYHETEGALEIIHSNGRLFAVVGSIHEQAYRETVERFLPSPPPRKKGIVAVDADSGRLLWRLRDRDSSEIMPTAMAVKNERLFFQNTRELICLNARSGDEEWRADRPIYTTRLSWSAPTLVACDEVVLSADGSTGGLPSEASRGQPRVEWINSDQDIRKHPVGDVYAFSAETGEKLWTRESLQGFCAPGDVFVIDDLVWAGALVAPGQKTLDVALDLKTGRVVKKRSGDAPPIGGHARCYRNKATQRYLVLGGTGVELVDLNDWSWTANLWVRGTCQYGVMPCNGMIYVPPDSCACRPNARLHGFAAMAPKRTTTWGVTQTESLKRGPAYGKIESRKSQIENPQDWPTYRKDNRRSGWTKSKVPADLSARWQKKIGGPPLGGKLTSLTISSGRVYVSHLDSHTVYALDAGSGEVSWSRTVGGPVDSPPTICRGLVVFGCRDGHVYCLRAGDGELVWRFLAAPADRLLMAQDGLESVWPVHGSVLIRDDQVWFAAGRSSYLDGGICLYALDLKSGNPVFVRRLDGRNPETWSTPKTGRPGATRNRLPGTLPDILSTSGDRVFMGWTCFDTEGRLRDVLEPHVFSTTGFLDDSWWHRTYWQYGSWMRGGFGGWPRAARQKPAGRLLVAGDDYIFGFGRSHYDPGNPKDVHAGHVGVVKDGYQDIGRIDYSRNPYRLFCAVKPEVSKSAKRSAIEYKWQKTVPIVVRAMLLADEKLFIAGPPAGRNLSGLAKLGTPQRGMLSAVSATDGDVLTTHKLESDPVLDGMATADECLYISTTDGNVLCLGRK
jgi:outer membrane protein assembly factor BamB